MRQVELSKTIEELRVERKKMQTILWWFENPSKSILFKLLIK